VDGFPDRDEVLTIYVAHDIQSATADPLVVDYLAQDPEIQRKGLTCTMCQKALEDIGFDADRLSLHVSNLSGAQRAAGGAAARATAVSDHALPPRRSRTRSPACRRERPCAIAARLRRPVRPLAHPAHPAVVGCTPNSRLSRARALRGARLTPRAGGWKMKLALARAVLLEAGLLLLDEPTNHMDTANVAWLQHYLLTCGVTLVTVSHDSSFLDTVCTDIIHYEAKKLVKYRGNLSAFVAVGPGLGGPGGVHPAPHCASVARGADAWSRARRRCRRPSRTTSSQTSSSSSRSPSRASWTA